MSDRTLRLIASQFQSGQIMAEHRAMVDAIDAADTGRKEITWLLGEMGRPLAAIVPVEVAERGQHPLMQVDAETGKVSEVPPAAIVSHRFNVTRLAKMFATMVQDGTLGLRWMNETGIGPRPVGVSLEAHIERWLTS